MVLQKPNYCKSNVKKYKTDIDSFTAVSFTKRLEFQESGWTKMNRQIVVMVLARLLKNKVSLTTLKIYRISQELTTFKWVRYLLTQPTMEVLSMQMFMHLQHFLSQCLPISSLKDILNCHL